MILNGKALCYGDHVDTDVIIPARYLNTSDQRNLLPTAWKILTRISNAWPGDYCSRQQLRLWLLKRHAPIAIKTSDISCVVAKSFARIFYRNSINIGLPIVVSDLDIKDGDQLEVDLDNGVIKNLSQNTQDSFPPFSPFLQELIAGGGLMNALTEGKL